MSINSQDDMLAVKDGNKEASIFMISSSIIFIFFTPSSLPLLFELLLSTPNNKSRIISTPVEIFLQADAVVAAGVVAVAGILASFLLFTTSAGAVSTVVVSADVGSAAGAGAAALLLVVVMFSGRTSVIVVSLSAGLAVAALFAFVVGVGVVVVDDDEDCVWTPRSAC